MLLGGAGIITTFQTISNNIAAISPTILPTPTITFVHHVASSDPTINFKQLCLFGLIPCPTTIISNQELGRFLGWKDTLTIAGIAFAVIQLMDTVKIRTYIYRLGWLLPYTVGSVIAAICLSILSTILVVFDTHIPILSYPATYEVAALLVLSLWLIANTIFFFDPKFFMPSYNNKLLFRIRRAFLSSQSNDSVDALLRITHFHLKKLVTTATQFNPTTSTSTTINKNAGEALRFIDVDLSSANIITYLGVNNLPFVMTFLGLAEELRLWDFGGRIFIDNLCEVLFTNDESLLSKELKLAGVSGVEKPLSNLLFTSFGLISHYRIFQSFPHYNANISNLTLRNWTNGLDIALRAYFSEKQNVVGIDSPTLALYVAITYLSSTLQAITYKIYKLDKEAVWDNEYNSKISIIVDFFQNLENILAQDDPQSEYQPKIPENTPEMNIDKNTVTDGIVKAMFEYLECFAIVEEEEYARFYAIRPMWLIFGDDGRKLFMNMRAKLAELIKKRFEENYKGNYHSMIKLMLNIYNGAIIGKQERKNPILDYVANEFNNVIAPRMLKEEKFRKENMPSSWWIDEKKLAIFREIHGKIEQLYSLG